MRLVARYRNFCNSTSNKLLCYEMNRFTVLAEQPQGLLFDRSTGTADRWQGLINVLYPLHQINAISCWSIHECIARRNQSLDDCTCQSLTRFVFSSMGKQEIILRFKPRQQL
jgi:flagellar biosynthesis/type III secretory pathway chaperone